MISIVIPVYNVAEHLCAMLDSIIGQSYTEIEIILVNDGSTDNSSMICHEYANKFNYISVYDQENRGVSASRNFGAKKATGEFIWFMDSDDVLEKDALVCAIEVQKKYDADVVIGGMNFCFTEKGTIVSRTIGNDLVLDGQELKHQYRELFSANYISSLCNKLIRRSLLIENNIQMNESLHMYEDYVFCMDTLLRCKKVVCLTKIFYNYQLRNTKSLSRRYKNNIIEMFCILEKKISGYRKEFGIEVASADASLNNLVIYLAYECVKNESHHKDRYTKIKRILCDETFHNAMLNYSGVGRKCRFVQMMMKNKMAFFLLMYFVINKKI